MPDLPPPPASRPERATPMRVQRKRTKGYKLPPNTVCVTRPSKWGNPYAVSRGIADGTWRVDGPGVYRSFTDRDDATIASLVLYRAYVRRAQVHCLAMPPVSELRGKNLACFCPLDRACHADILLELASAAGQPESERTK